MASGLKPSNGQLPNYHILGHYAQHLTWASAKKKVSKQVGTEVETCQVLRG